MVREGLKKRFYEFESVKRDIIGGEERREGERGGGGRRDGREVGEKVREEEGDEGGTNVVKGGKATEVTEGHSFSLSF